MRPLAILEHEPQMLLGLSWSELIAIFFPSSGLWILLSLLLSVVIANDLRQLILIVTGIYFVGETLTVLGIAYWYSRVRQNKPDGWHLHFIASKFYWTGLFRHVRHCGKWRC